MVRFICLEIRTTGVLAFECAFSSRWSSSVHRARVTFLLLVLAIANYSFMF